MKVKMVLTLLMILCLLTSCSSHESTKSDTIRSGFSAYDGISMSTPWITTAIETKKKQETMAKLVISVGHNQRFMEAWNQGILGTNPGYGKFAVHRIILDENREVYSEQYFDLPDFGEEKYYMRREYDKKAVHNVVSIQFNYSFNDIINFEEIVIDQGLIKYDICLVDDNNQFITRNFNFAMAIYAMASFKNNGTSIIFSESNGY